MTPDAYMKMVGTLEKPTSNPLYHAVLGMASEVGELSDLLKKAMVANDGVDRLDVLDELGDVLYYLAMAIRHAGASMDAVMVANVEKLRHRRVHGKDKAAERVLLVGRFGEKAPR